MTARPVFLRLAGQGDAAALAALFRQSRAITMPYLPVLHGVTQDRAYFRDVVLATCKVTVIEDEAGLVGFIAVRAGWIDHLYLEPARRRQGLGSRLLGTAIAGAPELRAWTFQRNDDAIAFYQAHGFAPVEWTDGSENEEGEPDVLLIWRREPE